MPADPLMRPPDRSAKYVQVNNPNGFLRAIIINVSVLSVNAFTPCIILLSTAGALIPF